MLNIVSTEILDSKYSMNRNTWVSIYRRHIHNLSCLPIIYKFLLYNNKYYNKYMML